RATGRCPPPPDWRSGLACCTPAPPYSLAKAARSRWPRPGNRTGAAGPAGRRDRRAAHPAADRHVAAGPGRAGGGDRRQRAGAPGRPGGGQPWRDMLLAGLTVAFATVPEELPILITVLLALGGRQLARQGALLRRLRAGETLGAVTTLVTDKTG